MGCDIHLVLERKFGDKWVGVDVFSGHESKHGRGWNSPLATSRNYSRFAHLAGVRGDGPEPRGFPELLSDTATFLHAEAASDYHSETWLTLKDAAELWFKTDHTEHEKDSLAAKWPESYYFGVDISSRDKAEDYRLIAWFDN